MIKLYAIYLMPFVILVVLQYVIGERVLITKMEKVAVGYIFIVLLFLISIGYGVYLRFFVQHMEALGLAVFFASLFIFFKYVGRPVEGGKS